MKRQTSILLATLLFLGSLFPKSDMGEVFKIPFLIQHYQAEHANLSFWDFFKLHYSQTNQHSDQDHEKLPLQKHNHNLCGLFQFVVPSYEATLLSMGAYCPEFKVIYTENYTFLSEKSLLQPPKPV